MRTTRSAVAQYASLATLLTVAGSALAGADPYAPPASYYSGATGTGSTLAGQLQSAMSAGHIQRSYGDYRYAAAITDQDPNNPGNILLCYNRASVSGSWDSGGTWNREHVWPQSLQPGSASNSTRGNLGDPHSLRPCNPSINSSRGNKPFGFGSTTGGFGSVGSFYFPGDVDKGDIARQLFYSEVRYNLTLVNGSPGSNQMGDLASLLAWNYLDVPDTFERRRNHAIFSQSMNPSYYTNNRNAFIDMPWTVWSIFMDQNNDTRLSVAAPMADGSSSLIINLGDRLIADFSPVPSATVTLNKTGSDGTYYEVIPDANVESSMTGKYNAFPIGGADSVDIELSLTDPIPLTPAIVSGFVEIDNLDITTAGGAGRGANDANDLVMLTYAVLDHANGSFSPDSDLDTLEIDLGTIEIDSGDAVTAVSVFNISDLAPELVADLDIELVSATGDTSALTTTLGTTSGIQAGPGGLLGVVSLSDDMVGEFTATFVFTTSDDQSLNGALAGVPLLLTLTGEVIGIVANCPGDANGDQVVDLGDLNAVLASFGTDNGGDVDGDGDTDLQDLNLVLSNFGSAC